MSPLRVAWLANILEYFLVADASVSKPWPRSNKKRESPSNGSTRNDTSRKPAPQKTKCFDKRPKARGAYNGSLLGGKSDAR